jgi:alpha-L-rhamnosidase
MASFNHYAFGSVDEWLYSHLAGIQPTSAGYRTSRIAPDFDAELDWVDASQDTPYGRLRVRWNRDPAEPHRITLDLEVPANTTAAVVLPETARSIAVVSAGRSVAATLDHVRPGRLTLTFVQ